MNREDEIKAEQLAIAAHQRRLDELLNGAWPRVGDRYWNSINPEYEFKWCGVPEGEIRCSLGLLHRTQEDAQAHHELMKVVHELRECDGFRPFVVNKRNWCFYYDALNAYIGTASYTTHGYGWEHVYYETEEQRTAALEKVGHDRVLKAMEWAVMGAR